MASYTELNKFAVKSRMSSADYQMMRGSIDFSNAKLFNLYESGYNFLKVLAVPEYVKVFAEDNKSVKSMLELFCWILEYEFRGLDGIEDITAEDMEYTDGISTLATIGKVTQQSVGEVSMNFTERSGLVITKFISWYLKGIKDPRTQAKTYHGLIKAGKMVGGFENEVFQLLYIVTDNTTLGLEKAYLLANAWPNKAETSLLASQKGEIDKKEISVTFKCFVIDGEDVDALAIRALAYIHEKGAVANYHTVAGNKNEAVAAIAEGTSSAAHTTVLDSSAGRYGSSDDPESNTGMIYKAIDDAMGHTNSSNSNAGIANLNTNTVGGAEIWANND